MTVFAVMDSHKLMRIYAVAMLHPQEVIIIMHMQSVQHIDPGWEYCIEWGCRSIVYGKGK